MATFLGLCVDARQECQVTGTGPATVAAQVGVLKSVVDWVSQSYTELQLARYWLWMRSTFTVNTVSGTDTYAYTACTDSRLGAVISRFFRWWLFDEDGDMNITCYLTSSGVGSEAYLIFMPWSDFRQLYKKGTQTNGTPVHVTIDPQNKLVLGPKPNAIFTINGEYQMSPQTLSVDADEPEMPSRFQRLIVYMAMEKYGASKGAGEIFQRGGYEGSKLRNQLELDQLPSVEIAEPLL